MKSYKIQSITFLFLWLVSMILSAEFILSVSMIGLLVLALFQLKFDGPQVRVTWRDTLAENWRRFKTEKVWWVITISFFIVLFSGIYSSDMDYTLERLRIKLPFLILPFAFLSMPKLTKKECYAILYFLLFLMFMTCCYVGMHYLSDFKNINELIGKGQPVPTPSNHIRFSLTLALSIIGGVALWWDNFYFSSKNERYFIGGMTLFLFAFIHVLSVRSGILALYLGLFVVGIHHAISSKKYWLILATVVGLTAVPFIAYQLFPSFQTKIAYAKWDFDQYRQSIGGNYSDSERITSLVVGLEIGNAHPLLGVGAGDLKQEVKKVYAEKFNGQYSYRKPHNQFLSHYAGTGIIGVLLFSFAFFFPLFYQKNYRNPLFLALHAIIFMSFMMENTVENNFGISLYLFFLLMGVNYLNGGRQTGQGAREKIRQV
jgi:O-antigen ligase